MVLLKVSKELKVVLLLFFSIILVIFFYISDPHIKVAGMKEAVAAAKDKILTVLDTKVCFYIFVNI